ncbi:TRAP transporter small permease subunit [Dinoroseobacter shibae]|jgi:TRAP-type C4-dicarboxylate transport system permease small subunit|nr:TRAP transporter small permease subunit [Dinoroseobacter shibae]URF47644.1 TRAP transporter small permease [Dinoroseobacter shibae]URF51954.1 TRAP transporter small permease [Dinoroseobacter shibae]
MTLFARIASGIAMAANAAGTFVVVALIAVVNYDIVARGLFNKPFLGAVEVVQFSMVLIVFLQLPDVIRVGRLTRSDGFLMLMPARRPALGSHLSQVIDLISALFMVLVAIAIWPEFVDMWATKNYFGARRLHCPVVAGQARDLPERLPVHGACPAAHLHTDRRRGPP